MLAQVSTLDDGEHMLGLAGTCRRDQLRRHRRDTYSQHHLVAAAFDAGA
jgi:hypothetical protein